MIRPRPSFIGVLVTFLAFAAVATMSPQPSSAVGCGQVVKAGIVRAEGCFTEVSSKVYEATQAIDLNGIQVRATPTSRLQIDTSTRRVIARDPAGSPTSIEIAIRGIPDTANPRVIRFGKLDFVAPREDNAEFSELVIGSAALTPPVLAGLSPFGSVDAPIKITEEDEGSYGEVVFTYRLPGALTVFDKQAAVSVPAELKPGVGAVFDGVEIEASGLTVGEPAAIGVEELAFTYRQSRQLFEGSLTIVFPRPTNPTKSVGLGGEARVENGVLKRIGLRGTRLGIPIFPAITVERIGAAVEPSPFKLEGTVGIDAGEEIPERVPIVGGNAPISGDVTLSAEAPSYGNPRNYGIGNVGLRGRVDLFGRIPVANAGFTVYYTTPISTPPSGRISSISFNANAGIGLPRFTGTASGNVLFIGGHISGWWEGKDYDRVRQTYRGSAYNFEGSVRTSILGWDVSGAQAVISTEGIAACVKPIWWSPYIGGGYSYRRGFSVLGGWSGCGIGAYRNTSRGAVASDLRWTSYARRARAAAETELLELDEDEQTIRIEGAGEVPSFTMESRDGERLDYRWSGKSPVFGPDRRWVVLGDPRTDTAYVLMRDPEGRWAISARPGAGGRASEIIAIGQAATQRPPAVEARVTGKGMRRMLRWKAQGLRERDEIRFVETIGEGGRNPVLDTDEARGSHRFTPALGPNRAHSLTAIVVRGGTPFEEENLDRFEVRPPKPPATPRRVRAERFGTKVMARWQKVEGARGYVVVLESPDGDLAVPRKVGRKRHKLTFADAPVRPKMRVKVYALGRLGFPSDPGVRRFPAIPPERSLGRSVRSMLRSAEVLPGGNLSFVAPCPGHGQCEAKVSVASRRGARLGHKRVRVVPESRKRMLVRLPKATARGLGSGASRQLRLRGIITQAGQSAADTRKARIGGR